MKYIGQIIWFSIEKIGSIKHISFSIDFSYLFIRETSSGYEIYVKKYSRTNSESSKMSSSNLHKITSWWVRLVPNFNTHLQFLYKRQPKRICLVQKIKILRIIVFVEPSIIMMQSSVWWKRITRFFTFNYTGIRCFID